MNHLIRRLIDSGMPRPVALSVVRQIRDRLELEQFVEQVEEESREQMDIL